MSSGNNPVGMVIVAMAVLACILMIVLSLRYYRKTGRREAKPNPQIAAWAQSYCWAYLPEETDLTSRWSCPPFVKPSFGVFGTYATQVVSGKSPAGHTFLSFTYSCSYIGPSGGIVRKWIVALQLPTPLPSLSVGPKGLGNNIADAASTSRFTTGYQPFDQRYKVDTSDTGFAAAVLQPQTNLWLLEQGQSIVPFRITGQDLLSWHAGAAPNGTPALAAQLAALDEFVATLPN